ncbi:MAG: hypothetical protein SF182_01500 [Deltaproteobacteria bacterium]|nr:hypothetical protein [Deltaproteobacteria bacterium]
MADADRLALATDALGYLLLRGGAFGDCVVVLDASSLLDAHRAWLGALVFTPMEIAALGAYRGDAASLAEVCRVKRLTGGTVVEVIAAEALAA